MRVVHAEAVFEELVSLSFHIALDDENVAQIFLDSCDKTFGFLAENRFAGAARKFDNPLLKDIRMWRVKGFEKYLIFYQPLVDGVKILHVVHSSKNYHLLFEEEK
jgi:toxin ParE1/3/4